MFIGVRCVWLVAATVRFADLLGPFSCHEVFAGEARPQMDFFVKQFWNKSTWMATRCCDVDTFQERGAAAAALQGAFRTRRCASVLQLSFNGVTEPICDWKYSVEPFPADLRVRAQAHTLQSLG